MILLLLTMAADLEFVPPKLELNPVCKTEFMTMQTQDPSTWSKLDLRLRKSLSTPLVTEEASRVSSVRPLLLALSALAVTCLRHQQTLVRSRTCQNGRCLRSQGLRLQSRNSTSTRLTTQDQDLAPSATARTEPNRKPTLEAQTVMVQKSWECSPTNAEVFRALESKFPSGERTPVVA